MSSTPSHYILSTGAGDVDRLQLLQEVYGPQSRAALQRAGLRAGLRVVEFGCGSGNMTLWLAEQVGASGRVVGLDSSADQIEQARLQAERRGVRNIDWVHADAAAPNLPAASFDLAYCRLLLMHAAEPRDVLQAMANLVRPGGLVLCEEMDIGRWVCDPPSAAMDRLFELNRLLGERCGGHFQLGSSLHRLFRAAGLGPIDVQANFPFAAHGETKRLLGLSFQEFAPELVQDGLATQAEVDAITVEARRLADDDATLFGFPLVVQVTGRVGPAGAGG